MEENEFISEILVYIGVSEEQKSEVLPLYKAAVERINRATSTDWRLRKDNETFREAVKLSVWIAYHAIRDNVKNTVFLSEYLTELICVLQLTALGTPTVPP